MPMPAPPRDTAAKFATVKPFRLSSVITISCCAQSKRDFLHDAKGEAEDHYVRHAANLAKIYRVGSRLAGAAPAPSRFSFDKQVLRHPQAITHSPAD
jgi:hypothetical protein